MKHARVHRLRATSGWQSVGMYDGARPLVPYFRNGKLYLPCIEDDEAPEVPEQILVAREEEGLDEAFGDREAAYVGSAVGDQIGPVFVFVELEPELPARRITHPALQDAQEEDPRKESQD